MRLIEADMYLELCNDTECTPLEASSVPESAVRHCFQHTSQLMKLPSCQVKPTFGHLTIPPTTVSEFARNYTLLTKRR